MHRAPRPRTASQLLFMIALGAASLGFRASLPTDSGLELAWWTDSSGGIPVENASGLRLEAALGQHDAGAVSNAQYELVGGYWALLGAGSDDAGSPPCPTDLDFDGSTNAGDIAILLSAWGPATQPTFADITLDGQVDASDLAMLLAAWGPCDAS